MFTIASRCSAAAAFALALTAASSSANAEIVTGSCVGGWGMGNCSFTYREYERDTHTRHVPGGWGFEMTEQERKEAIARDRKWIAFCKPAIVTDRYGVSRYLYAKQGCEYGRSE